MMPVTELDRDTIFLFHALTESARALRAIDEIPVLAGVREQVQEGVERRHNDAVFEKMRLALHYSANVSKIFWPQRGNSVAEARGDRLRRLASLPPVHPLSHRRLRNHIEHMDERLDDWTSNSPRPFLQTQLVLQPEVPDGAHRDEIVGATAIAYDARANAILLFGDVFILDELRAAILEVQALASRALEVATAQWGATTG